MTTLIVIVIFVVLGGLSLYAAIFNLKWFFESQNGKIFTKWLGHTGARVFYGVLGALILCMAYLLFGEFTPR